MKEIAIVTGGGRGIGAATVHRLAKDGYAVCVNYRQSEESAEQLVTELLRYWIKAVQPVPFELILR